jgi:predicted GTPase
VQRGINPIRLVIEATQPEALPANYRRYLEHQFRETLGIAHAPIDLRFMRPRRRRRARAGAA